MVTCYRLEQWKVLFGIYGQEVLWRVPAVWDRKHLCPRGGGIPQQSFILWSSALRSSSLPFYIFLLREKIPLPYPWVPSIDKWYPFQIPSLELCITFSCCQCTVFKLWINQKTRKLSGVFTAIKSFCYSALLGAFTERNETDFSTLSHTSTVKILTLSSTWSLEKVPLLQFERSFPV